MRFERSRTAVAAVAFIFALSLAAGAFATVYLDVLGSVRGVASAKLTYRDSRNASIIGRVTRSGRDTRYSGRVVYYYYFGTKSATSGRYPLEMFSNGSHNVFQFTINSASYPTSKGIRVGSSEAALKSAYASAGLTGPTGSTYRRYTIGPGPFTDFYCKNGKVTSIVMRTR